MKKLTLSALVVLASLTGLANTAVQSNIGNSEQNNGLQKQIVDRTFIISIPGAAVGGEGEIFYSPEKIGEAVLAAKRGYQTAGVTKQIIILLPVPEQAAEQAPTAILPGVGPLYGD